MNPESIDEIQLVTAAAPDRLPAMLFLAALIHGILIIGVTFNAYILDELSSAISLEVTIVADPNQAIDRPDDSEYLAQASQVGGGNTTEEVRPTAPLQSASPIDNLGEENADRLVESTVHERSADQVLNTQAEQQVKVADELREKPQTEESIAIALESGSEQSLPLPESDAASWLIHDDDPRELVISADTRESIVAPYLDNWQRRIEAVGREYFTEYGQLDGMIGSPTLEVTIEASGQLSSVIILESSGSRIVDQAALDILRRAAPFDPFPADVSAEYDRFRIPRKWRFDSQSVSTTAQVN